MPERPLLIFPQPDIVIKRRRFGGPGEVKFPTPRRQAQRLESRISAVEQYFIRRTAELRADLAGVEPEEVLVLETVGSVDDFVNAINRIPGLNWLGDVDVDNITADEDFYKDEEHREVLLSGRLYLIMSNQRGIQALLRLFNIFKANPDHPQFEYGQGRWRAIFSQLKDIRPWGAEDRLRETGIIEDWEQRVQSGEETVPFEVELWFRENPQKLIEAFNRVSRNILELHGEVISQAILEEIRYHALVGRIPIQNVTSLNNLRETRLVRSSEIMVLRPVGQAAVPLPVEDSTPGYHEPTISPPTERRPIVALLDGLPLENHQWLDGRLIVDDVDNWAAETIAEERVHGTAMASLILHGELDRSEEPLRRPLYVRPIMKPNPADRRRPREESIPENRLPVDIVRTAVRRLYENDEGEEPVAPSVRIINLSVCERNRQFYQYPSPWARVIDYLSWYYNVLFIVSAGNHADDLQLDTNTSDLNTLVTHPTDIQRQVLNAVNNDARNRRLCVPSETINALTIGAQHGDFSNPSVYPPSIVNPFSNFSCVSPYSAQGAGFRRSVKPDILMPGGRQLYRDNIIGNHGKIVLSPLENVLAPGQRVASPSRRPGVRDATTFSRGTSNAAALATRLASQLYEQILDMRTEPNGNHLTEEYMPVLIKALIVHGSAWSTLGQTIRESIPTNDKNVLTRLLGYGAVDSTRLFECSEERATIIGVGAINDGEAHRYTIPLPASLNGVRIKRKLTITLAWLTPINPSHQSYRVAELWFEPYGERREESNAMDLLMVDRREVRTPSTRRGTVQHEIFEGDHASSYGPNDFFRVQVNCSADAGRLSETVRYALVVSLEVAPGHYIPIYNDIRIRLQQPVTVVV